ncbi:hypothetical protein F5B22DRAFT_8836 [Xylaria bambusicola]|uniref:uncharacterized protein n=1 Tax=Xylaria bambusicola TaxID=326684 RepID=UPI00200840C7|nr:uncharacterized protein F5B22DRAFT_8836 [Xylaria bambusicola]KAI0527880.1 hypothetical protein F5B22DRAFT_8836 [Xylaria bambusicola]
MKHIKFLLSALIAVSSSRAGPTPVLDLSTIGSAETELLVREGINFARSQDIEKRASADFSLERSWNNEVLFGGEWNDTTPDNAGSAHAELSVTCLTCYTHGTVTAKVTDKHFLKPQLKLSFSGVQAYANLDVRASAGQTFSLNLFASDSPLGIGISGLDVGVVFFVDLVFSISEAIDLTAGFQVSVPDDAYLEADIFGGDIDDSAFEGLNSQSLPVTVVSGTATFKADLRLRVQAGAEASIDLFGIGAGAVIGIYANIIEFVAVIEKTPTCDLETEIWWDLNVGAYAHLDVVVDYTTLGPVPTVSTTLLAADTITSCWVEAPTTPALPATTSDVAASSSLPVISSTPAETGSTEVPSSVEATSASATESTLTWSPSMVLTVTASEISFSMPDASPTDSASSLSTPATPSSSAAPLTTSTSLSQSSYSPGGSSFSVSASSVYYSSSVAAVSSHNYAAITYPISLPISVSIPSAYSSSPSPSPSSSSAVVGPTYTSTYTHTMTICGAPGVMNCPATYQTEVIVTRTTTICPATPTLTSTTTPISTPNTDPSALSIPPTPSTPTVPSSDVVIILTPLPTPIKATFTAPKSTPTEHAKAYTYDHLSPAEKPETTTATITSTTTITALVSSHSSVFPTPTSLTIPAVSVVIPNVNVPGIGNGTTVSSTGFVPGATPSGISTPGPQTPVIAAAGRVSGDDAAYANALIAVLVALSIRFL